MPLAPFKHILCPGRQIYLPSKPPCNTFVHIRFDGFRLSITGVQGPLHNGDARGASCQIWSELLTDPWADFHPGWDMAKVEQLVKIWKRWHLNDLNAGTPKQMKFISSLPRQYGFKEQQDLLRDAGLNPDPDTGYYYGSAWLYERIPEDVIYMLKEFPISTIQPVWV